MKIDLNDNISNNFIWKEALWLNTWKMYAYPEDREKQNIIFVAEKLELIRHLFQRPLVITSWFRPRSYNEFIGGSKNSGHIYGMACDFAIPGIDAYRVRRELVQHLESYQIRMEKLPDAATWIHIDIKQPGLSGRYFTP